MGGTITKWHFFKIARYFGIRAAFRILFSKDKTALLTLFIEA